jgi:methylmalonyl-CoA mutase C-terminal domain/subunit
MVERTIRILIAKLGLDGHDRGAKLVAHALRAAGMEVIYLGLRHTAQQAATMAINKQVDYIGLSFLSGDHLTLVPKVLQELQGHDAGAIKVIVGGIILKEHVQPLLDLGVKQVFLPGTPMTEIVEFIRNN